MIGNFVAAEEHLFDRPELAARIRQFRLYWIERVFDGNGEPPDLDQVERVSMINALDDMLREVNELRLNDGALPPEGEADGKED
jgi:hypothetical protein